GYDDDGHGAGSLDRMESARPFRQRRPAARRWRRRARRRGAERTMQRDDFGASDTDVGRLHRDPLEVARGHGAAARRQLLARRGLALLDRSGAAPAARSEKVARVGDPEPGRAERLDRPHPPPARRTSAVAISPDDDVSTMRDERRDTASAPRAVDGM